jgi:hypothetical protein
MARREFAEALARASAAAPPARTFLSFIDDAARVYN